MSSLIYSLCTIKVCTIHPVFCVCILHLSSTLSIQPIPTPHPGSLSSSGVVNCIIDYMGFDMSVSAAAGNTCSNNIKRIQDAFDTLTSTSEGFLNAKNLFFCDADMDLVDFFYMIADSWSMMIQYSAKTSFCAAIDLPEEASVEEVAKNFAAFSNSYWGTGFCAGGFYNTKQLKDPERWEVNAR